MGTEYLIHDNGGRPFRVCITDKHVRVDKIISIDDDDVIKKHKTLFEWKDVANIFIGPSPKNRMTLFSGGYGPRFLGNTILLHMKDLTYIWIGECIYQFDALFPITTFVSPVGNSDVPYPFAFDTNKNCYLLTEYVCVASVPEENQEDPYDWYYDTCGQMGERYGKLIIGGHEYNNSFHYESDWAKEYLRLSRLEREEEDPECDVIYITKNTAEAKQVLPLDEFIAQHEAFAKDVLQVTGLRNYQLLQKRSF
jgi:hypothetical protein